MGSKTDYYYSGFRKYVKSKDLEAYDKEYFKRKTHNYKFFIPFIYKYIDIDMEAKSLSKPEEYTLFGLFLNEYKLDSKQIRFLDTIKSFLTSKGKIDPAELYESPFAGYHPKAIDGVFNKTQTDRIFEILGDNNSGNAS